MSGNGERAIPGRTALVTGGAQGIGKAICEALADDGHRIVVADINGEAATATAAEIDDATGVQVDVTDTASVAACVAQAGQVDILVNCAGWDDLMPFLKTDEPFWDKVIEINYKGPLRLCHAVVPGMGERGWGRVINIASDAGRVGSSMESVYSGAKGGIISFGKTLAREVARSGVTVNAVCPGPTDTPMLRGVVEAAPDGEKVIKAMTAGVAMKRLGQPHEIAAAVRFFAREDAGFITGQTLSVSGGLTMAG